MRYEQTISEGGKGTGKGETLRRGDYASKLMGQIGSAIYAEESKRRIGERASRVGVNPRDKINAGSEDRMKGIVYNPTKYANEQDQNAYKEGFFVRGSRILAANLETLEPLEFKRVARSDVLSGAIMTETPLLQTKREVYLKYLEECKKVGEEILKRQQAAMQIYSGGYKNAGQIVIDSMQNNPKCR